LDKVAAPIPKSLLLVALQLIYLLLLL